MRNRVHIKFVIGLLAIMTVASCSRFRTIQKSDDWKVKYEAAFDYYEQEDYYRAIILFEEIMPLIRAMKEGEKVQFYYAYCHFYQKSYLLSAHYFKNFATTYSRSEYAEEAHFMHAYSLYMDSPIYNLDQTSTKQAITALQNFLNRFPDSKYFKRVTAIIDALQFKLERKAYENAKQYLKLELYESAVIAFDNFNKDYPGSNLNEEIDFLKISAQYQYANQSVASKQVDRFQKTIDFYYEFLDNYPDSEYLSEAEKLYADSMNEISKLASIN